MALNAQQIIQQANVRLGINFNTQTDPLNDVNISYLNKVITDLRLNDWQFLIKNVDLVFDYEVLKDDQGTYVQIPNDLQVLINKASYNENTRWINENATEAEWSSLRLFNYNDQGLAFKVSNNRYYLLGDQQTTINITYKSKFTVLNNNVLVENITGYSDTTLFNDQLLILGLSLEIGKYQDIANTYAPQLLAEYNLLRTQLLQQDVTKPKIRGRNNRSPGLNGRGVLVPYYNVARYVGPN